MIGLNFIPKPVYANADADCKDVALVFLRGSGQNKEAQHTSTPFDEKTFGKVEKESFKFFTWFKQHLEGEYPHVTYKPVTIHDFPGKYSPVGYQAVGVGIMQPANTTNAELSVLPGDYRASVEEGVIETVGYLKDQIAQCPNQNIIIGGYSQGAQVVGEALFQLTPAERSKILATGLFGDPKFLGAQHTDVNDPLSPRISYPWTRGDMLDSDTGMLDGRVPYLPDDMASKTVSYCYRADIVCSGWTGFRGIENTAHGDYGNEPMRNTVNELIGWAAPQLAAAERIRGGLGEGQVAPTGDNKQRDIMFMLNDQSVNSVISTMRFNLDQYLNPVANRYPNTAFAAKGFGEGWYSPADVPRVDNIQTGFLPYTGFDPNKPSITTSNLKSSFISRYPSGQPYMGNGDIADPHGVAIERAALDSGWRTGSEKHLVLITDRPPKETYAYNICNATVRSWMHIPNTDGYSACYSNFGNDIWPSAQHPEVCETIYLALTQDQCKNPLKQPGFTQMINRSLKDAIKLAQAQGVVVDVIVPYVVTDPYNQFGVDKMMNNLKNIATSTGGVFVYYDKQTQFNGAALSDMMYQVFGHKPKQLTITYKEALNGQTAFESGPVLNAQTNVPVILDVSSSATTYPAYKWDFNDDEVWDEQTPGPTVQHVFNSTNQGFLRVAGLDSSNDVVAETRISLVLTPGQLPIQPQPPNTPSVAASTNADGSITLSWQSDQPGQLIIIDPESKLPLLTVDLLIGTTTLNTDQVYQQLAIRVANDQATSSSQAINVAPYIPPLTILPVQQQTQDNKESQQTASPAPIPEQNTSVTTANQQASQQEIAPDNTLISSPQVAGVQQTLPETNAPVTKQTIANVESEPKIWPIIAALLVTLVLGIGVWQQRTKS